MPISNGGRLERGSREIKSLSWFPQDSTEGQPQSIRKELNHIGSSLDSLRQEITSQQCFVTREFESRIRHVYDSVLGDLNEVRNQVNGLGDLVASGNKFKTWVPTSPFRKATIENVCEINDTSMCKSNESILTCKRDYSLSPETKYARVRWLRASSAGELCRSRSQSNHSVSGYGCCFNGEPQTRPHRETNVSKNKLRHSWAASSIMTEHNTCTTITNNNNDDTNGCLSGDITDDWRVKVAPYMWDGWHIPGLNKGDVHLAERRLRRFGELREEIVEAHNMYRRRHGCGDLSPCPSLTQEAQTWADTLACKGYAQYSEMEDRGENILIVDIDGDITGQEIAAHWYREGRFYNFTQPKWQRGARNFTQMIWQGTRQLGVGLAKVPGCDRYIIVAQYRPPGNSNSPGEFEKNIHPIVKTVTSTSDGRH